MTRKIMFALLNGRTSAGSRVYPNVEKTGASRPLILFQEVGGGSMQSANGAQGVAMTRVQVTAIGDTYDSADNILEQARLALDGFRGTVAGKYVQHCLMIPGSKIDIPSVTPEAELQTRFGRSADFNIFHIETVPSPS